MPCDLTYVESNEQNKLVNRIETEAWTHGTNRLTAVRGEWVEGLDERRGRD